MAELFENPPILTGRPEDQLRQLYNHLFRMSSQLNEALMAISINQMAPETQEILRAGAGAQAQNASNMESLKSLIIKNADMVRTEMTEIRTALEGQYTAISDQFGIYQESVETQLSATATGIEQNISMIETVAAAGEDTATVLRKLNANIFSGILDEVTGEAGIAIGYNVTNNDGTINHANKTATFTADQLTFYIGETAVAWFGNSVFHITDGEVTNSMRMGSYTWKVMANGSMGLMKA